MSRSDYRKLVKPGDPLQIPALAWNRLQRMADWGDSQQHGTSADRTGGLPQGLVLVKNASGADRNRFEVLGIDGPAISPSDNLPEFQNRIALTGSTPDMASHLGRFVICYEPMANNGYGLAWAFGLAVVKIFLVDAGHNNADIADGDATQLQSAWDGAAKILSHDPVTHWSYVLLGVVANYEDCDDASDSGSGSGDTIDSGSGSGGSGS